jgi:hypothetical protein
LKGKFSTDFCDLQHRISFEIVEFQPVNVGTDKLQVSILNVGKDIFRSEMAVAAGVVLPQVPFIQNFLVAVKVMNGGGGQTNLHMGIPVLVEDILVQPKLGGAGLKSAGK